MSNRRTKKRNQEPRKWLPNIAELIDRLSIHQLKEVFINEHKDKYAQEMTDIVYDIDSAIAESNIKFTGEIIHLVICIAQINEHIWYNESKARGGEEQDLRLLKLTHSLNGIRNRLMNKLLAEVGFVDRQEYKTDCLAAEHRVWGLSILEESK